MTTNITRLTTAIVAAIAMTTCAQAGSLSVVQVDNTSGGPPLNGFVTSDILISTDPGEAIGAIQIYANLTEGSFYQDGFGGNTPPTAAFVGLVPSLAYDTFLASGTPLSPQVPLIFGASVDLGSPNTGGPEVINATTVDATFSPAAGQNTQGVSNFLAARLSIGSTGTLRMLVDFSGQGDSADVNWQIMDGQILVPDTNQPPMVDSAIFDPAYPNNLVTHTFTGDDDGGAGNLNWELLSLEKTGNPGAIPTNAPNFNPATQQFDWLPNIADLMGGLSAEWVATVRATDGGGLTGDGTLTINLLIPEPASFALAGLAMIGLLGLIRRR